MHQMWVAWEEHRFSAVPLDDIGNGVYGWWCLYRLQKKQMIAVFERNNGTHYVSLTHKGMSYCALQEMLASVRKARASFATPETAEDTA